MGCAQGPHGGGVPGAAGEVLGEGGKVGAGAVLGQFPHKGGELFQGDLDAPFGRGLWLVFDGIFGLGCGGGGGANLPRCRAPCGGEDPQKTGVLQQLADSDGSPGQDD
ncbi:MULTISPECIES: hypothetical protein [Streptomyces]|uniref:hypothetical protein n=1 Tax=Streptomyces TaxID=1883 RepID=UPI00345C1FB0